MKKKGLHDPLDNSNLPTLMDEEESPTQEQAPPSGPIGARGEGPARYATVEYGTD